MSLEILFTAWNRRAFTAATFDLLVANTDWALADALVVYDDGSEDGTAEMLYERISTLDSDLVIEFRQTNLGGPPAVMNHYLRTCKADAFVKVDNDIAVPPGWLATLADVAERHPMFDLIGMEAGRMGYPGQDLDHPVGAYRVEDCSHIGGVGFMRRAAFKGLPMPQDGRFGFTQYQRRVGMTRGWIFPDLLVPQLDRVPTEPWASLSAAYIERGWQRSWPSMDPHWSLPYFDWLPEPQEVAA